MNISIHRNGQNYGPYTLEQVKEQVATGSLVPSDLAWYEGCSTWIPLGEVIAETISPPATIPPPPPLALGEKPPFFSVSLLKLIVLSIVTFGLYELYWMCQNWKLIKEREGQAMRPFWRAFFAVIWIYPLFKRMRDSLAAHETNAPEKTIPAGALAITWVLIYFLYKLPDPYWCLSTFTFVALIPVQLKVNKMNAAVAPNYSLNSRFTWANWFWIVIGGALFILAIIGSALPDK